MVLTKIDEETEYRILRTSFWAHKIYILYYNLACLFNTILWQREHLHLKKGDNLICASTIHHFILYFIYHIWLTTLDPLLFIFVC